jgi:hypothetical protein
VASTPLYSARETAILTEIFSWFSSVISAKCQKIIIIDVAIPSDKNVIQKEAEKKLKYKNLSIEIQKIWNMKCFFIPVIIGATGIVSKSLQKYLETIPGQHSIDSLQKLPY